MQFKEIISIENKYRKGVHVSLVYVDMCKDLNAGILLSQILYWHTGEKMAGEYLVKRRDEWYDECRLTVKQYDRAINILKVMGIVEVKVKRSNFYNGNTVPHIKINRSIFENLFSEALGIEEIADRELPKGENPNDSKGISGSDKRSLPSITESTSEITPKIEIALKTFNNFWLLYDKRTNQKKCFKIWLKIKSELHTTIYSHVKEYVKSTPDKKYRKNPETYLNNECWNDEIVKGKDQLTSDDIYGRRP